MYVYTSYIKMQIYISVTVSLCIVCIDTWGRQQRSIYSTDMNTDSVAVPVDLAEDEDIDSYLQ